jgi:peptidoglycan/xylan/chitin deacetylase (PgdA/CDA1 family)
VEKKSITLTFHGIGEPARSLDRGEAEFWVTHEEFIGVLDAATRRRDVRVTFDDGNASDLELALPALRDHRLSSTFFVVAGRLGEPGFVDQDDVRALAAAGMTVGSHGMRHVPWPEVDDRTLHEELVEARERLEAVVGRTVSEAACPFGSYDRRVLSALRRAGYRRVYTSDRGTARPGAWLQPRNTMRRGEGPGMLDHISAPPTMTAHLCRRMRLTAKRWR